MRRIANNIIITDAMNASRRLDGDFLDERGDWAIRFGRHAGVAKFEVLMLGAPYFQFDIQQDFIVVLNETGCGSRSVLPRWVLLELLAEIQLSAAKAVQHDLDTGTPDPEQE